MRLADLRVGEVGALAELLCRHLGLYLGGLDEVGLQLLRMLEGEVAGALVDLQHARDGFRILLSERLAHVQDAVGVEVGVAEEQPRARLQLGLRHVRRSEEQTSELPSPMRHSYAVFCLQKKKKKK